MQQPNYHSFQPVIGNSSQREAPAPRNSSVGLSTHRGRSSREPVPPWTLSTGRRSEYYNKSTTSKQTNRHYFSVPQRQIGTGINPSTAGAEDQEEDHAGEEATEPHLLLSTRYDHTSEVGQTNFNHEHFVRDLNPAPTSGPKRQQLVAAGSGLPSTPVREICTFMQIYTNTNQTKMSTPSGVW